MASNGNWFFYAMLIELLLFVSIMAYQYNHVSTSLDNKLVL
jgi:hypothetical protein